jgi:rhodanese-related sulfurtransferase
MRLGRIGFDHVIGYLKDGLRSADASAARIVTTERIAAGVAADRLTSAEPPLVVDVRAQSERAQKRIAGSVHIPLTRLNERMSEIPRDTPVLVHCAGGYRSSIAASLLQREGHPNVSELAGGMTAWEGAGLPVESGT